MTVQQDRDDDAAPRPAQPDHADDARPSPQALARRRFLTGAAAVGVGGVALVACGSDETGGTGSAQQKEKPSDADKGGGTGQGGGTTVATSDVPVGGGTVLKDAKVVVAQPARGEYTAFSAVCTHQGCLVTSVANGTISCPCHGSRYSAEDGSVTGGPAPRPLDKVAVTREGDRLVLG